MVQLFQYFAIRLFCLVLLVVAIVFLVQAVRVKMWGKSKVTYFLITTVCVALMVYLWNLNLFSYESTNREDLIPAFESNFGFLPPEEVEEIKPKNYVIYDSDAHWMSFTYDSMVFDRILEHDQPLKLLDQDSLGFESVVNELASNQNNPPWFLVNSRNTNKVYLKEDFLNSTRSEYYLWVDSENNMVNLFVGSSD